MKKRVFSPVIPLSLLLIFSTTVQAGPISINGVVQVVGRYQNTNQVPDLRLRNVSQVYNSLVDNSTTKSAKESGKTASQTPSATDTVPSLLSGIAVGADDSQGKVDVISQGDIEGSICDCGEIPYIEGGGFPKWPFLFLAAIPFFFIHHEENTPEVPPPSGLTPTQQSLPTPTPTPTPPPTGVPEPTSLLLMGSGLAAVIGGLRRRRSRPGLTEATAAAEEA